MWHHSFDPHSLKDVPDIPLAELRPPPNRPSCLVRGSETVREFLDRSNIQTCQKSFIQQALEKGSTPPPLNQSIGKDSNSAQREKEE